MREASCYGSRASNKVSMKSVSQNLLREIEYLRALVLMYEQEDNQLEREAALDAVVALERLLYVINHPDNDSPASLPIAA
jgi:hypothetical protein